MYWLMKSEPEELSIGDLAASPRTKFRWDGVRNYQARNMMRDRMRVGDLFFFAHSSCAVPGVAGIAEIVTEPYPDPTQFDPASHYFDAGSRVDEPRWVSRDVRFVEAFATVLALRTLRLHAGELGEFALLRKANRLSVMPVTGEQWLLITRLAGQA